jgi:hypothetical protein
MHKAARPLTELAGAHPRHAELPRARIALIGQPLLPKQLQGVEARRMKKRCHEASDTISCTRGRPQASKMSDRRQAGQRRAHGHVVVLTSVPQ